MKEGASKLREKLSNKDNESVQSLKEAADEYQRQSLKLFETAYKKVRKMNFDLDESMTHRCICLCILDAIGS